VEGTPDWDGIHQSIRPLSKSFSDDIRNTAPMFFPFEGGAIERYTHPTFLRCEEEPEIGSGDEDVMCVDLVQTMADE
jgi:hypothetical protein